MIRRQFSLDEPVPVPSLLTTHEVDGRTIIIAPEQPNWIITDALGASLIRRWREGVTLGKSIAMTAQEAGIAADTVRRKAHELLAECTRCAFWEDAAVNDLDQNPYPLRMHCYVTNRCNLRCIHCYQAAGKPLPNELTTDEWIAAIRAFSERVTKTTVSLSGGEPLVRRDFFTIARAVKSCGHRTFLFTNGMLIDDKNFPLLRETVDALQISLDGATAEAHDRIRGKGSFTRVVDAVQRCAREGMEVCLGVTAMDENIDDLEQHLITFLDGLGVNDLKVGVGVARRIGRYQCTSGSGEVNPIIPFYPRLQPIQEALYERGWDTPARNRRVRKRNCTFGERCTIAANGDVYACAELIGKPLGNVRTESCAAFLPHLARMHAATSVSELPECASCDLRFLCRGGCKTLRLIQGIRFSATHCPPEAKMLLYRKMVNGDIV